MKAIFYLAILCFGLLSVTGCDNNRNLGPVTIEVYDVQDFDRVKIASLGNVTLHDGPEFNVVIETHAEILKDVEVEVVGGTLEIDYRKNTNSNRIDRFEINITAPLYKGVSLTGVANITGNDGFETSDLEVDLQGVGNITLRNIDAETLDVDLDGVGDIELGGMVQSGNILLKDVGNVRAFDLLLQDCVATLRGVGDIKVYVTDYLDATITGVGDIIYMGDPVVDSNVTGEGKVRKR